MDNTASGEATVKRHDETVAEGAVQSPPPNAERVGVTFALLPSGKPVVLDLPGDLNWEEAYALVESVAQACRQIVTTGGPNRSRLVLPGAGRPW